MAVTTGELSIALRLTADGTGLSLAQTAILARLLGVGEAHVDLLIPKAPDDIKAECVIRISSYLYEAPVGRRDSYSNAWVNSGAGALASRWHQQAVSGGGTPGASPSTIAEGIDEAAVLALFATWTQVGNTDQIPADKLANAGGGLGTDTDTVARASAQEAHDAADAAQVDATTAQGAADAAQADADAAQADADAAQGEIDTHEASTHNVDSTARSEAQAAQGLITGHEVATAPHNDAITELIEAHRLVSDSHHTPGMGGVGGLTAAAAAQADLDAHEATQHNHDAGARTAAANAQITAESARDAAAAAQSDADTAQTTAGQAQATATAAQADIDSHEANHPGGGGTPPTVLYDGTTTLAGGSAKLPGEIVCPQTGFLEIYLEAMAGNRSNSVGSLKVPATRVYAANAAIGATYANNGTTNNIMAIPLGANRAAHISANATDHHIAMGSPDAGSAGDYYVRIAHVA